MKKIKAILAMVFVLVLVLSVPAAAQGTGKSYVYNHNGVAQEIPDPYAVTATIGYDLGMITPVDMVVRNDMLFILDTGHKAEDMDGHTTRLLVLDKEYNLVKTQYFYNLDGTPFKSFAEPRGLWIDENGKIYVTDRSAHFLFIFDDKGVIDNSLPKPVSPMIQYENEAYLPTKVLTDHLGVIYVRVENDYRGFIMMEPDGTFLGYFGSNEVVRTAEAIMLQFWKRFMTPEQLEKMTKLLPMEYANFCIDKEGSFIYGVRGTTENMTELVRKINCKGKNVLDNKEQFGDVSLTRVRGQWLKTNFNGITVDDSGFITTFDSTWQRLFQYTPAGELMYVFGGKGSQEGTFTRGADIEAWGDQILVLDEDYATVTVMQPTTFGKNVRLGETYYSQGNYKASLEPFRAVVTECMNYEFGYQGIGKALYMERDYEGAMDMFYLAHDQKDYSMAWKMQRGENMRNMTVPALIVVMVLIVAWIVVKILKAKGIIKEKKLVLDESGKGKYILHTILHPIEGFEEMRYNKKYSLGIANTCIFFFFFSSVIMALYSGFIFNGKSAQTYNMIFTIAGVLGGFTLFVLVNWLMATFLDGKGNFKEVWIYLGYATIPYSVTCFLYTLLSNFLTAEESTFLSYLIIIGYGWSIVMAFFALQGLHMYGFWMNVLSIVVTILGMLVVLFIVFLMFNLFIQFFSFGENLVKEIMYRMAVGF
ncbi:MAG: hypothetical protein E7553_04135 [Ruminococcaceae bacterium]|nr:hypothetical protein [Oscillospiraceae bacterium]